MHGHHRACHTPSSGPRLQGQSHQHPQAQGNWPIAGGVGTAGDPCLSLPDSLSQNCRVEMSVLGGRKGPSGWVSGPLSSLHMNHPTPFLSFSGLNNPLAHHESRARNCPCGSPCAARDDLGKRGAGGLGCRRLGQQKCWLSLLVQEYHRLWQEERCQRSREARAPTAGGDYHSPLKLDQSEKSEVLRGSGSGLATSSI